MSLASRRRALMGGNQPTVEPLALYKNTGSGVIAPEAGDFVAAGQIAGTQSSNEGGFYKQINPTCLYLHSGRLSGHASNSCSFASTKKIDLSKYKSIRFVGQRSGTGTWSTDVWGGVVVAPSVTDASAANDAYGGQGNYFRSALSASGDFDVTIEIPSQFRGEMYVGMCASCWVVGKNIKYSIKEIWLE